jgi:hypothetical protein
LEGILPNENRRRRGKSFGLIAIGVYEEEEEELRMRSCTLLLEELCIYI